jgi:hypothetical protein
MSVPYIPDNILEIERRLTAEEISIYKIYAGKNGELAGKQKFFESAIPQLKDYFFEMDSVVADNMGLYTVTIYKRSSQPKKPPFIETR